MSLQTPAPPAYDQRNEASFRAALVLLLKTVFAKGRDIEVGQGRLILKDSVDGQRYSLTIASGVVTVVGPL